MPLTLDHEILTQEGWKAYNDIKRTTRGPDGKPVGENDILVCLDTINNVIVNEEFAGELYLSKKTRVVYNIKNNFIDTSIAENSYLLYKYNKYNENESIKIDKIAVILSYMNQNNINEFYLLNNSTSFKVNISDIIKDSIDTDYFTFVTNLKTFYVRRNNLEFWTSY